MKLSHQQIFQIKKSEQDPFIDDMAYTLMAIDDAIPIKKISIMTLSKDYRLVMDLDKLFITSDVTDRVKARKIEFDVVKNEIARQVTSDSAPVAKWIFGCKECEFFQSICLGKGLNNPIFNLPRINEKKCIELFGMNSYEIKSVPESFPLTDIQSRVRNATANNEPILFGHLQNQLEKIEWPVYYLDFETFKTAVPIYPDVAPHEQVVTQYSLHSLQDLYQNPDHLDFLADPKMDCRRNLAEHLILHLGDMGSIIVYSGFEKTILNGLAKRFPDLEGRIQDIVNRLVDLKAVIQNNYYHPEFYGSYSIKDVLPVLIPEMSYDNLAIRNGDEAIAAFVNMVKNDLPDEQIAISRKRLLDYCCQDTLAMVELHKKLVIIASNP